jgi:hypothetical protein
MPALEARHRDTSQTGMPGSTRSCYPPQKPHLSPEQRQALELLAGAPTNGCTKGRLLADGFDADMLIDLVREGSPLRDAGP